MSLAENVFNRAVGTDYIFYCNILLNTISQEKYA